MENTELTAETFAVLVPARNENASIAAVVTQAREQAALVLVVDDGSSDTTAKVARTAGAEVIVNKGTSGLGVALQKGLSRLVELGFHTIASVDGDGAHDPLLLPGLVKHHVETGADLTIGSRLLIPRPSNFPSTKESANRFAAKLLNQVAGTRLSDVASGMRVFGLRAATLAGLSSGFGYSYELLCEAKVRSMHIEEYPIPVRYDARQVFATRREEFTDLLQAASRYSLCTADKQKVDCLSEMVAVFKEFSVSLDGGVFVLHPLRDFNLYMIQEQHPYFTDESRKTANTLIEF